MDLADLGTKKKSCKYPKCETSYFTKTINKHFYRFPSNPVLHNRWKKSLKLDNSINCRNFTICEDHFRPENFVNTSKHRLNHNVVPIEYFDDHHIVEHDHCYARVNETNEPPISTPAINTEHNYVRIEGPDLKNIESIVIPNNPPLSAPILIQTQPNQNLVILNGRSLLKTPIERTNPMKSMNSIGTSCNLVSPTIEMKFKVYEQTQRKLRAKIRLLQHRYGKSQRNLRELRTMLNKEDIIGLIRKRKFKSLSNLTDIGEMLILSQLRNASARTPYARRYTHEELEFFVELYRRGPAMYRFLDQYLILPSKRTIKSVMHKQREQATDEHNYGIDVGCELHELEFLADETVIEIQQ